MEVIVTTAFWAGRFSSHTTAANSKMTHEDFSRTEEVKGSSNRSFGIVFAVVFLIVALFPLLDSWADFEKVRIWSLAISVAFLIVAFVRPGLLSPLNKLWLKFGLLLHKIISPLVLGMMFFLVLTPIALFMRMRGKDLLNLRTNTDDESYWIARSDEVPPSMKNQF